MHAAHYVQYKAIKKAFRIALPSETEFIAMLKNELAQINQHVEGCIGTMASVTPRRIVPRALAVLRRVRQSQYIHPA